MHLFFVCRLRMYGTLLAIGSARTNTMLAPIHTRELWDRTLLTSHDAEREKNYNSTERILLCVVVLSWWRCTIRDWMALGWEMFFFCLLPFFSFFLFGSTREQPRRWHHHTLGINPNDITPCGESDELRQHWIILLCCGAAVVFTGEYDGRWFCFALPCLFFFFFV